MPKGSRTILLLGLEIHLDLQRVVDPLAEAQTHIGALGLQLGVVSAAHPAGQIHHLRCRGTRPHHPGVDRIGVGVDQFPIGGLESPLAGLGQAQPQFAGIVQQIGAAELEQRHRLRVAHAVVETQDAGRRVVVVQAECVVLVVNRSIAGATADPAQAQGDRRLRGLDFTGFGLGGLLGLFVGGLREG
jgi:hypothetical protein